MRLNGNLLPRKQCVRASCITVCACFGAKKRCDAHEADKTNECHTFIYLRGARLCVCVRVVFGAKSLTTTILLFSRGF